ncbi:amino acid/polyamine/organocation transporter, APC superfamily [Paraburkholderia caballeronis]|uniref:L-asparagine transporter n=2 Tax=Paraburkholderia caballeronis TaxID=416943 RepID=A0A1H7PKZ9_9BURK|nr:amino acid permease [Paraburkholderia caballeronis]PXW24207.1 amino acid/polyamine/organocation transporter (APC superfamily) [Paraburkholderia caballeronis]PXW99988.1 amino acid/polyamine/organocation transporter (APC superfamily) [Paraburkholderia caballeronis]RAJ97118.1 amino acid/polyamine/organocation transporter (APC superfamily) [Paraburkholderia caballeronis]SEB74064.1 amino acid/polyamine/organocation transporter, APC superfamily [Paraburkholderia caballeronis]SEL35925.1 L-asparagi
MAIEKKHAFDSIVERERGLRRGLSAGQMTMIAIGGAVGTGLFLGSGFAISFAGPGVLVSYAVGALIALLLMGALAEMTVAHPTSGSFGAYAEHYIGPLAGFVVRYAYWSAYVLAVGTEVAAIAVYMKFWFPGVPGLWWIVGFSAALIAVNAMSVRAYGTIEYLFSSLKIAAIVAFILLGAWYVWRAPAGSGVGFANYTAHGGLIPKGWWGVWVGTIVALFSYLGVETIAVAAAEAQDPQRAVTRAFRGTILRLVLFYLLTLALMLAIVPWTEAGANQSPFVKVMAETGVPYAAGAINFVVLVAALSAMNSQLYITTRMMFSLSRAGYAPAVFGRLTRSSVPTAALSLSTIGIAVAAVLNALYPQTAFTLMMSIAMFGAMFTWLMIFVTHLFFRRRYAGPTPAFRMWGHPFGSVLGALLMAGILVTTAFTREFRMTLAYGLAFVVALVVAYAVWYRRRAIVAAEKEASRAGL